MSSAPPRLISSLTFLSSKARSFSSISQVSKAAASTFMSIMATWEASTTVACILSSLNSNRASSTTTPRVSTILLIKSCRAVTFNMSSSLSMAKRPRDGL